MSGIIRFRRREASIPNVSRLRQAITAAQTVEEIVDLEAQIEAAEGYMRKSGHPIEEIRPFNEARMLARWKLGRVLSKILRAPSGRPAKSSYPVTTFKALKKQLGLNNRTVVTADRIGMLDPKGLDEALHVARERGELMSFSQLLDVARPIWSMALRKLKHAAIKETALQQGAPDYLGPFPLIYADPPWTFITPNPQQSRNPEQHYPVLSDQELIDFKVFGRSILDLAGDDSALFMWCTSANLKRALAVLEGWGFTYKTHAVWDKDAIGTGYIFRNQHELLLYGDRGAPARPVMVYPSVFRFKRTTHSAKPPEVREALERMYPAFDVRTRIELFARGVVDGWSTFGHEAKPVEAVG